MITNERDLLIFGDNGFGKSAIVEQLKSNAWNVLATDSSDAALEFVNKNHPPVGIICFSSEDPGNSFAQISLIRACESVKWIAVLNFNPADQSSAMSSTIYSSCCDFLPQPVDVERLLHSIGHAYGRAKLGKLSMGEQENIEGRFGMFGRSPLMLKLFSSIEKIAASDEFVMIHGETGTGKELIARAIHENSGRRDKPFVPINCGALPKDLIFSELFGHAKGAFTNAYRDSRGLLECADGGTVFFDEVGELQIEQQVALLRFLQDQTFYRIGETRPVRINVRVLSATNKNMDNAVKTGIFRSDLYYRLNVVEITAPPLRHRRNDRLMIAHWALNQAVKTNRLSSKAFSRDAIKSMKDYLWPGNVRELIHRVNRAVLLSRGAVITAADLDLEVEPVRETTLNQVREQAEANAIRYSLLKTGNVAYSAKQLGVSRVTLYRLINKYGIDPRNS
ncbi:MAG: sigma-54 dependent transcriptional regulator [Methylococcaceae bacterium]|nr:sigma-54 dependent transcriptional regulator [Methylococcaceae bacterium]